MSDGTSPMSYDDMAAEAQRKHSEWVAAQRQATMEHVTSCPACTDTMADVTERLRENGFEGEVYPTLSPQCHAWINGGLRNLMHANGPRGMNRAEVEAA